MSGDLNGWNLGSVRVSHAGGYPESRVAFGASFGSIPGRSGQEPANDAKILARSAAASTLMVNNPWGTLSIITLSEVS